MPRRNMSRHLIAAVLALSLAGCAPDYSAHTYAAAAVQQANKVERGVVAGFREVAVSAEGTVGALTGGAAGGIAASQSPFGPVSRAFTTLGGTLVGGFVGSATEHAVGNTKAWEYIVREPSGELISVTQADQIPLAIGQSVLVITGKQARVVPDYTVKLPEAAPEAAKSEPARPLSVQVVPPQAVPVPLTSSPSPPSQ